MSSIMYLCVTTEEMKYILKAKENELSESAEVKCTDFNNSGIIKQSCGPQSMKTH